MLTTGVIKPLHEATPWINSFVLVESTDKSTVITVLNCSKGYWHQPLDDESSYLTTFNTEIGQFRLTVMPFGATVSGDVFQRKLDSIFLNLENVMIITDDIMVIGYQEDEQDHDRHSHSYWKLPRRIISS